MYRFSLITEQEAIAVLHWRYDDLTVMLQPVEQNFAEDLHALLLPEFNYYAVHDEADELVGFYC